VIIWCSIINSLRKNQVIIQMKNDPVVTESFINRPIRQNKALVASVNMADDSINSDEELHDVPENEEDTPCSDEEFQVRKTFRGVINEDEHTEFYSG